MRLVKKFLLGIFLIIAPFLYSQETHLTNENVPDILKIKMDLLMQENRILKRENDKLKQELNQFKLNKRILQLKEDVAKIRGFKIKNPLETQLMTKSELLKYIEEEFSRQYPGENLSHYQEALIRLGFIPQGCDVRATLKELFAEQVAGLYDDTTQRFYLIDTFYQKNSISDVILAHEICHALQDQNFNIAAMGMRQPDNDDAVYAKLAMLEGDATILMSEWLQKNFNITNLFQLVGMLGVDQSAYTNAPYFLQQILVFPYIQGAAFVMEAMAENGMDGRDYVIKYPPRSTEQVLHPDKYFYDVDEPTTVTLPESFVASGEIWNRIYHNVFGEMGFKFLFDQYVPGNKSAQAATGWDGDRYAIYRDGKGGFALRWDSIWDTEEDAKEAAEALRTVMMKRYHDYQETVLESGWEWTKPNDEKENEATFIRLVRTSVFARLILSNNPDAAKSFISMK